MSDDDRRPLLRLHDGKLQVVVPDGVELADDELAALREDKAALEALVEVFGAVRVEQVAGPRVWPPRTGFVPSWRGVRGKHLDIVPSEHGTSIDAYADQEPSTPCQTCTVRPRRTPSPETFTTGRWQVCLRCDGTTWRRTAYGDECATCPPLPDPVPSPGWYRAGGGWVCRVCHPPVPPTTAHWRAICAVCGGMGKCKPNHDECLRRELERRLKRTTSPKRRAQIEAALAPLPPLPPKAKASAVSQKVQRWRPPKIGTSRMPRT